MKNANTVAFTELAVDRQALGPLIPVAARAQTSSLPETTIEFYEEAFDQVLKAPVE